MAKKNGGPAFPRPMGHNGLSHHEEHECSDDQAGMDIRTWLAGQALAGLAVAFWGERDSLSSDVVGAQAVKLADATLEALAKE